MVNKEETRKIQKTGGSTFTLSLPKRWIEKMDLEASDGITVEEKGSSLLLSPADVREEERGEAEVEVGTEEDFGTVTRQILSLYLVGYNSIKIKSTGDRLRAHHRNAIKELVRNKLVGTEVISESIEEITLQTLLSYSELSAKEALRRMYRVASSMLENSMLALEKQDKELAEDIIQIDDEVDRFQMYLIREIKAAMQDPTLVEEIGLSTLRECLGYRLVSKNVERVGDHAISIAENVLEMESEATGKPLKMLKEVNSLASSIFQRSIDSLFEENYNEAEEIIQDTERVYDLEEKINQYLAEEDPPEDIRIRLILESIRRIAEHGGDIAEIVLNLTVVEDR